jgi:hypothetical protein
MPYFYRREQASGGLRPFFKTAFSGVTLSAAKGLII